MAFFNTLNAGQKFPDVITVEKRDIRQMNAENGIIMVENKGISMYVKYVRRMVTQQNNVITTKKKD